MNKLLKIKIIFKLVFRYRLTVSQQSTTPIKPKIFFKPFAYTSYQIPSSILSAW